MTEEEQKAIRLLQHFGSMTEYWKRKQYTSNEIDNYIKVVLNLIAEQQREIEKLRREKEPSGEFFMSKNGIIIKIIDNRKGDK